MQRKFYTAKSPGDSPGFLWDGYYGRVIGRLPAGFH